MKQSRKLALWAAVLLLAATVLALPVLAAPAPDPNSAVMDDAGILSRDTEAYINDISAALQNTCGAQIGVYTTEYVGNSTMEGFAYEVFTAWGLGSASADNGVLLLLAPGEDDYFIMRGEGLETQLSLSSLQTLLDKNLEDAWVAQDYDTGVCQTVEALADKLCKIYGVSIQLDDSAQTVRRESRVSFSSIVVLVLVLVIVLLALISSMLRPRVVYARPRWFWAPRRPRRPPPPPYGGYGYGPGPPPPPPRSSRPPRPPRSGGYSAPRSSGFHSSSRPSGVGRSSGGSRPSGGGFRAGGGSTRGGGVGRRH